MNESDTDYWKGCVDSCLASVSILEVEFERNFLV